MKQISFAILIFILNAMKVLCSRFKNPPKILNDLLTEHYPRNSSEIVKDDLIMSEGKTHENALRLLEDTSHSHFFESINYIPLDKLRPFSFFNNIGTQIQQNYSELLLYPYTIFHSNGTSSNGGIFDINKKTNGKFVPNWPLKEIQFSKAKPLYLINIGIVSKQTLSEELEVELFYEDKYLCDYFVSYNFLYKRCSKYYEEYEALRSKGTIEPFIVYLNEESLLKILLNKDGTNKIDLLFIPDFYTGKMDEAIAYFTPQVLETINKFLENRGTLVTFGKSSILLESIGYIEPNTYDTTYYIRSIKKDYNVTLKECDDVVYTPPEPSVASSIETEAVFHKNIICTGLNVYNNGSTVTFYQMNKEHINDFEALVSYQNYKEELRYLNITDGKYTQIEEDTVETPYLMTKPLKKGRLFIFNSNPIYRNTQQPLFQNVFFYSSLKDANLLANLIMTDSNPIPSGENNVELRVDLNFTNYSPYELSADIHVFLPKYYMMYLDYDKTVCALCSVPIYKDDYDIEKNNLNASSHLLCHYDTVMPNQLIYLMIKVGFSSISTNEFATNINIMQPMAYYTNKKFPTTKQFIKTPVIQAKTAKAAFLKGTIDSSGLTFYPLPGRGKEQKTTVKIQNKYTTEAKSIEYIDVIPLITPIIDGNTYSLMGRAMPFMSDYYKQKEFKVPFKNIGDSDYLDILYLNNRNVRLVPDYDQPVIVEKEARTTDKYGPVDSIGNNKKVSIGNINYSTLIDDPNTILKQIFIGKDSNDLDASQRLMCFVDDTNKNTQREILFARIDIHFKNSSGYKPTGISNQHVISIDKDKSKDIQWGSFNQDGLNPTKFINTLLDNDDITILNGTNTEEIQKVTKDIIPIHYLLPVQSKDIESAAQLKDFTLEVDGSGYHNDYPCIKFIKAHSISFSFKVKNENCQGGKLIIHLSEGITIDSSNPVKEGKISFSSDKIAFTNTIYDPNQNTIEIFFKSGLLTLENSNVVINIESLSLHQSFTVHVETFEMKYDLSVKENNHEVYINAFNYDLEAVYSNFFSLPAIEMRIFTKTILGNQIKSPFTEYSNYIQELYHRTVYGSMKSYHVTEPGAQLMTSGFSLITKIGATSEHLINYISGKSTAVPSSSSSSRIEWVDLWNRNWAQPIGTLFTSNPSDGTNKFSDKFAVATTFELTQNNGKTRVLKWKPDEEVELRVKIKISNNYNKYFEPTICKSNQLPFKTGDYPSNNRVYEDAPSDLEYTSTDDKTQLTFGHTLDYGKCYMNPLSYMSGKAITQSDYTELSTVKICSPYVSYDEFEKCIAEMDLKLKVSSSGKNFSPDLEAYYPKGYITPEMWNMKIKGYDEHAISKGYKYHHDNNLPSIDQEIDVPQNIIGFPILKPIDYIFSYDKSLSLNTFPNYKGWWSDNLQNRDNSLLAGQTDSYQVSEQQSSPLTEDKWIHYSQLNSQTASEKSKNEYICLFNQKRIKTIAKQSKYAYVSNVLQNNIVPIIQNPKTDINCEVIPQYTDKNISQYDNKVVTQSDIDWLYFASNLRAQAKETINIVMKLKGVNYIEGIIKILDGIEFNYWNPLSEPDTFTKLTTDSTVIEGVDGALEIQSEAWPKTCDVAPMCSFLMLFTFIDKGLKFREYEHDSYYNSYGFGDVSTGVIVGGINGTKCKIYPGNASYIEVTITNNAGYDFNILKNGIEYSGSESGSDLLKKDVSNIQNPTKINIITFDIPSTLKDHIVIEPSDHLSNLTYQEISFNNYNPTSIKDGTKAHFYFKMTIKETFSNNEKLMMKEIPVLLNTEYFDHIIGKDDLLPSLHDYTILIPPIKFGVPHSTSENADKIFNVFEYNKHLYFGFYLNGFEVSQTVTHTNETLMEHLKEESVKYKYQMHTFTSYIAKEIATTMPIRYSCRLNLDPNGKNDFYMICHFDKSITTLPVKQGKGLPDLHKLFLLLLFSNSLKLGTIPVFRPGVFSYIDHRGQNRTATSPPAQNIKVDGPLLRIKQNHTLISVLKEGQIFEFKDNLIYATDSGIIRFGAFFENVGNVYAYNITVGYDFGTHVRFLRNITGPVYQVLYDNVFENGKIQVNIFTTVTLPVGEGFYLEYDLSFEPNVNRQLEELDNEANIETERQIVTKMEIGMVFANVPEQPEGRYEVNDKYVIKYPDGGKSRRKEINVNIINTGTFENPILKIYPETKYFKYEEEDYHFALFRHINSSDINETGWEKISESVTNETFEDTPLTNISNIISDYAIEYRVEAYVVQTGNYAALGINTLRVKKKDFEVRQKNTSNLVLILVITLTLVFILLTITIIIAGYYRLSKNKKEKAMKMKKDNIEKCNYDNSVPMEDLDIKRSEFKSNNVLTEDDLSPTKLKRDLNSQLRQPNFIRIRRRVSTHGTMSIQNFMSKND